MALYRASGTERVQTFNVNGDTLIKVKKVGLGSSPQRRTSLCDRIHLMGFIIRDDAVSD